MTRARDTGRAPGERQQRVTDQRRFQSQIGGFRIIRRFEQLVAVQREAKGSLRRAPRLVVVDPFARFADLHGLLEAVERQLGQGAFIADGNRVVVEVFHDWRQRGGDPTDHGGALGGFSGKLAEVLSRLPASPVLHQIGENRVEPEGVAPLYGRARSVLLEPRGRAALLQLNLAQSLGVHPHLVSLRPEARSQSRASLLHQVHRLVAPRHRGRQLARAHQPFARSQQRRAPVALQQVANRLTPNQRRRGEPVERFQRDAPDANHAFPRLGGIENVARPSRAPALEQSLQSSGPGVDVERARVAAAADPATRAEELQRLLHLRRGLQRLRQRPSNRRRRRV